jgi:hypothetical protein
MASAKLAVKMIEANLTVAGIPWFNPETGETLPISRRVELLCAKAASEEQGRK